MPNQYQNPNPYPNLYPNQTPNPYPNQPTNPPVKKKSTVKLVLLIVGIFLAVCILLLIISVRIFDRLFYGVTDASPKRNNEWVKKMNDTFPDDEFEFVSYDVTGVTGLGSFENKNAIVLSSKKYPDYKVVVGWDENHTKLETDYNYVRYKENLKNYYQDQIKKYFYPDEIDTAYRIDFVEKTELKDYSFEEYRDEHKDVCKLSVQMKYNGAFPSEEEMTRAIDSFVDDLNSKIEMTIYLSHDSVEPLQSTEGNERYNLRMESPTKIDYLNHYVVHWTETKTHKKLRRDIETVIYE